MMMKHLIIFSYLKLITQLNGFLVSQPVGEKEAVGSHAKCLEIDNEFCSKISV